MATRSLATTLDPLDPAVRSAAARLATEFDDDTAVGQVIGSILRDVAGGERVVVLRSSEELTPSQAATMLGVTRQYVDRLCEDGVLAFRRLPSSSHRRIRVEDVIAVAAERDRRRSGHAAPRDALGDAGLLDEN